MIWYLLYVVGLRSTSQPPRLSANHPIRRAFYRHGKTTAEHWLIAMLVSVAIAGGFSYPTIFLSENPTAGLAAFPHDTWTTAKPVEGDPEAADVEMRQVWVHGSYMKALEKDVLKSALDIQQTLVGGETLTAIFPSLGEKLRSSTLSWGYHSPLMYWNNSRSMIEGDDDILRTINDQARSSSSLNVALRPASVFAGKKFDHRKLTAADALVITLMNKVDDNAGDQWRGRMTSLTTGACENCTLFPRNGHITTNRVYEFSFTPLSLQENVMFTIAYTCMALYVLLSLRRIKAFHSRFGLVVTAITQMTCSILASFTICGMLKINLSMIPQNAYPFVVLVIGLENMFRIINAVLAYPPTMATELRIANALGDVGPVSVATAAQNLTILSILARLVSPGVAAFCAFACIATLFDAFFLLTFFVAVLNVDIRRFELQDALARANQQRHRRWPSPTHHHTWFDALMRGRLPFSTRMAGTAVTTTFILSLNYHFFEHPEKATSLRHLLTLLKNGPPTMNEFDTFAPPPINASLTPGQWMRMQDFDTAKEVMRLAKPGADSFIIRVFAPLIVVLSGADRTDMDEEEAWTTALRSFAIHHFYPVAVAVVFVVAFVAVLMNFLLYTEHADDLNDVDRDDEEALSVRPIALPHNLDIIELAGTDNGHFVTVGLDRSIAIAIFDRSQQNHQILGLTTDTLHLIHWPIHQAALDDSGEWLACHCADERILFYSCARGMFTNQPLQYPDDNPPLYFRFTRLPSAEGSKLHFLVLTSDGILAMCNLESGGMKMMRLSETPLLGAGFLEVSSPGRRLVAVTNEAQILCYSWTEGNWIESTALPLPVPTVHGRISGTVNIEHHPEQGLGLLVITTTKAIVFLDSQSLQILSSIEAREDDSAFSRLMLGQSTKCPSCGLLAFRCAAIVDDSFDGCNCNMTTLWAEGNDDEPVICLRSETSSCQSFAKAHRTKHTLAKPGAWSPTASQAVLGLRRMATEGNLKQYRARSSAKHLRNRRHARSNAQTVDDPEDVWEAYKFSLDGKIDTVDVRTTREANAQHDAALYVSSAGPAITLDGQSIAVAFGNTVKLIKSTRRGSMVRRKTGRLA